MSRIAYYEDTIQQFVAADADSIHVFSSPAAQRTVPGIIPGGRRFAPTAAVTSIKGSIGATIVVRWRIRGIGGGLAILALLLAPGNVALQGPGQPLLALLRSGFPAGHVSIFGPDPPRVKRRGCARPPPVACVRPRETQGALP